ncbi:MAG: CbiX/SirB N-terminal domain-containing protein [Planctomycetota bacterium]
MFKQICLTTSILIMLTNCNVTERNEASILSDRCKRNIKQTVILAMHGAPPAGFPREELEELVSLHERLEGQPDGKDSAREQQHAKLDAKIRAWPRTPQNDPFYFASERMAQGLSRELGCEVIAGFNEFCAPDIDQAIDRAATEGAGRIIVITPMLTSGGRHAAEDIPEIIKRAKEKYPYIPIVYAWPFGEDDITGFLAGQIRKYTK